MSIPLPFDNSYARLGAPFLASVLPTPVSAPRLVKLNRRLARDLGLDPDALATPEGVAVLAGNAIAGGSEPVATAYAGHQFGSFVPQLGDGRAILLGEILGLDGIRRDIQLKGSGPTPFSRRGDGRAALGPVLREYIVSEAMAALGIPTTRALAAVTTGDLVARETALPGAILTRVAASHIRVGTFQFFAARKDVDGLRRLADHVIARHYPEASASPEPYRALLAGVIARQAALVARWMHVGFIHGVMNTDNMSVAGETIDFGPCAFMDVTNPSTVFSSIDYMGRYAYKNQPGIAHWNLARLAEALLPLLADDPAAAVEIANDALAGFVSAYDDADLAGLRQKLGLLNPREEDSALAYDLLTRMAAQKVDFTLTFRRLSDAAANPEADGARALFAEPEAFDAWAAAWRARLAHEADVGASQAAMRHANPAFIPRNHLVEAALAAAVEAQNFAPFEELVTVLAKPYEDQPDHAALAAPPAQIDAAYQTFCGT
ncbi:MAG: YdiU family protein [Beijerinckiaceae bacterium]|nr:YdiU family protein [Beijerinckiaceae bacterium]